MKKSILTLKERVKLMKIFNRNILIDLILVIVLVIVFAIILRYIFPIINQSKDYILYFFKKVLYLSFLFSF